MHVHIFSKNCLIFLFLTNFIRFERKYYYSKRSKSKENPSEYLSIIVDGMDQCKLKFNYFDNFSEVFNEFLM